MSVYTTAPTLHGKAWLIVTGTLSCASECATLSERTHTPDLTWISATVQHCRRVDRSESSTKTPSPSRKASTWCEVAQSNGEPRPIWSPHGSHSSLLGVHPRGSGVPVLGHRHLTVTIDLTHTHTYTHIHAPAVGWRRAAVARQTTASTRPCSHLSPPRRRRRA